MPVTLQPAAMKYKTAGGTFKNADCIKGDKGDPGDTGLPEVSAEDNGKVLKVVSGEWAAAQPDTLPPASGVSF